MKTSLETKFALICATLAVLAVIALAACDQGEGPTLYTGTHGNRGAATHRNAGPRPDGNRNCQA